MSFHGYLTSSPALSHVLSGQQSHSAENIAKKCASKHLNAVKRNSNNCALKLHRGGKHLISIFQRLLMGENCPNNFLIDPRLEGQGMPLRFSKVTSYNLTNQKLYLRQDALFKLFVIINYK